MSDTTGHDAPERDELHTMTLRELEAKVAAAGVLISRRQLMRHCASGTFIAKKLPATNNVDEWFIAPGSVEKGIADIKTLQELRARRAATRHDTSDHVEVAAPMENPHERDRDASGHGASQPDMSGAKNKDDRGATQPDAARHGTTDLDIYEHPYVKRLEGQVEKLEGKLEAQVRRTEEIQQRAQDKLVELQRMTTIGQSKTLADFMLQAKNWIVGSEVEGTSTPEGAGKSSL